MINSCIPLITCLVYLDGSVNRCIDVSMFLVFGRMMDIFNICCNHT